MTNDHPYLEAVLIALLLIISLLGQAFFIPEALPEEKVASNETKLSEVSATTIPVSIDEGETIELGTELTASTNSLQATWTPLPDLEKSGLNPLLIPISDNLEEIRSLTPNNPPVEVSTKPIPSSLPAPIELDSPDYSRPIGKLPKGIINSIMAPVGKDLGLYLELGEKPAHVKVELLSLDGKLFKSLLDKIIKEKYNTLWLPLKKIPRETYWLNIEIDGESLRQRIGDNCAITWIENAKFPREEPKTEVKEESCAELLKAVKSNDLARVQQLLKSVDPDCTYYEDGEPRSALVAAARKGYLDIGKVLVSSGAKVEFRARGDESPLMASSAYGHLDFVQYLVNEGADVNRKVSGDGTALLVASREGHEEVVRYLIRQKADVNSKVGGDGTPLINAVREDRLVVAEILLENGADPYLHSSGDEYPMYHARMSGNKKMINLLKKYEKE